MFRTVHFCQTQPEGAARVAEERIAASRLSRRVRAAARTVVGPVRELDSPVSAGVPPGSWWDRASAQYDRQLWLERSAVNRALDLLAARADERLLDVGTGTGEVLRQLARRPIRGHRR